MIKRCFNCQGSNELCTICDDYTYKVIQQNREGDGFCKLWRKTESQINRPVIYVASPLRADSEYERKGNMERARAYCRQVIISGGIPYAPHLLFTQFMQDVDQEERDIALEMGREMITRCDELWVFGNKITEGMQGEIETAKKNKIPVVFI